MATECKTNERDEMTMLRRVPQFLLAGILAFLFFAVVDGPSP
jgi:hypothetical protein